MIANLPLSQIDRGIVDELYQKYSKVIRTLAVKVCKINNKKVVSVDDLCQAGALGIIFAINNYKDNPKKISTTYVLTCIKHEMYREANQFQDIFTINNQIKGIINMIAKYRKAGLVDGDIAVCLGFDQKKFKNYADLLDSRSEEIQGD